MTISSIGSTNSLAFPRITPSTASNSAAEVQAQMNQAKELMLRTLEFAFYKQQDMNLKLVRVVGALYQGQKLDTTA